VARLLQVVERERNPGDGDERIGGGGVREQRGAMLALALALSQMRLHLPR